MAQTKKKRRRKHRGTQGGRIDTRPTKPRNRAEAKQRAKTRRSGGGSSSRKRPAAGMGSRPLEPPTWNAAIKKGGIAAVFFFVLIAFVFGRGAANAIGISGLMLLFYIPMSFYLDRFFFNRQLRKEQQERTKAQQGG